MTQTFALQISPEAKSAYFADYLSVARAELALIAGIEEPRLQQYGELDFFIIDIDEQRCVELLKLSFVQGIYHVAGNHLVPLNMALPFALHPDFVFGSKFKGKTNERLTQLLLNIGLSQVSDPLSVKLLDPMCGRATTLLWAMRYGIPARGIEIDIQAIPDIQRNVKKWTKIHRQKHLMRDGYIGKANKKGLGRYLDFTADECNFRVVQGDGSTPAESYKKEKFDLIVSDLPYGVQHFASGTDRNPMAVIERCVKPWADILKKHGVVVIAYNKNNPKRDEVVACFEKNGFDVLAHDFSHRMSESIVRDVIIAKKVSGLK